MGDEEVDAQFAAVFARMLAANFAREVRSKDGSDDERAADKPQDPPADNRAPPPTTAAGEQAKGAVPARRGCTYAFAPNINPPSPTSPLSPAVVLVSPGIFGGEQSIGRRARAR